MEIPLNKFYVLSHKDPLISCTYDNGYFYNLSWACDGAESLNGCLNGIKGFNQSTGIKRKILNLGFRCEICDYDLCNKCV